MRAPLDGPVSAVDVTVTLGLEVILQHVSLTVSPGEFVAIGGTNGSGKTTLLNVLGGRGVRDSPPSDGRVLWANTDIYCLSPRQRSALRATSLGYLSQNPKLGLLPTETVAYNLRFGADLRGCPINTVRMKEVVDHYGLQGVLTKRIGELSGGQQQIVAVAAIEISAPTKIFLDEPTASLSPDRTALVEDRLRSLARDRGNVVVVVTNDSSLRADRHVEIRQGRLEESLPLAPSGGVPT